MHSNATVTMAPAQRSAAVVPYTWGRYFPGVLYTPEDRRAILSAQLGGLFSTEAGRELLQVGGNAAHRYPRSRANCDCTRCLLPVGRRPGTPLEPCVNAARVF